MRLLRSGVKLNAFPVIPPDVECTLEANPGTLNEHRLLKYHALGINRLSLGLQSIHEDQLKILGRIHSFSDFKNNIVNAKRIGFENIGADLIFGIPGQSAKSWEQTLAEVVATGVKHISCYSLSVEEGTRLHAMIANNTVPAPDEELDRYMYHHALEFLGKSGFIHYEISNFALPGYECRHNLNYWTRGEYVGFGAGASSHYNSVRYSNEASIRDYIDRINSNGSAVCVEHSEMLDNVEKMKEYAILRLRLSEGIHSGEFEAEFNIGFFDVFGDAVRKLVQEGLLSVGSAKNVSVINSANQGNSVNSANSDSQGNSANSANQISCADMENSLDDSRIICLTKKGLDYANLAFMEFI
jgi:oxygen-independent coproporphyrinogen-3 oxidase